jgi:hypothetical protein
MPCVYNQAIRVAIKVNVKVVKAVEEGLRGIIVVKDLRGSDIIVSVF